MRIGQHVIFFRSAPGILPFAHAHVAERSRVALVAGRLERLRGPAEARALIARALGVVAAAGARFVGAFRIVQAALGAPHNVRGQRRIRLAAHRLIRLLMQCERRRLLKEAERILHLPDDVGGRGCADLNEKERKGSKPKGRREPTHEYLPHPSTWQDHT